MERIRECEVGQKNKNNAVIYVINWEERAKVQRAGLSAAGKLWDYCQPIIDKLAGKTSGKRKGPRIFRT